MNVNVIVLTGNLVRDPELNPAGKGKVCKFSLAISTGFGDKQYTSYVDCEAWGKIGESVSTYCKKGNKIGITGSMYQNRWEGKDGKRSKIIVKITQPVEFLFSTKDTGESDIPFDVGDPVYAKKRGYGPDYPGKISKVSRDSAEVEFDDGAKETFKWSELIVITK